jgi:hypothetical protein
MGSPGRSDPPAVVVVVAGALVVVAAVVLVVVEVDVVVVASDEVVVSTTVVAVVVEAASSPQAASMSIETASAARPDRDLTSFLSSNQINAKLSTAGSDQVPVNSGFLFSTKAVMASVRSSEIK